MHVCTEHICKQVHINASKRAKSLQGPAVRLAMCQHKQLSQCLQWRQQDFPSHQFISLRNPSCRHIQAVQQLHNTVSHTKVEIYQVGLKVAVR
jgi:hypothetical protein